MNGNPIKMILARRRYKADKINGAELGKRIGLQEGTNRSSRSMGYAMKPWLLYNGNRKGRSGERRWGARQGERGTAIAGASTSCHGRQRGMPGLSRRSSNRVPSTPEANLRARSPLPWIDNSPLTSGLVFHLQTPCSDLERSPPFHPHRSGEAGSRLAATCRHMTSRAVGVVLAAAPVRARRLRAGGAAAAEARRGALRPPITPWVSRRTLNKPRQNFRYVSGRRRWPASPRAR